MEEGKLKYLGLSEASSSDIRRTHGVHRITAAQLEWSLWSRDVGEDVIATCRCVQIFVLSLSWLAANSRACCFRVCRMELSPVWLWNCYRELGIAIVASSPFGRGFFSSLKVCDLGPGDFRMACPFPFQCFFSLHPRAGELLCRVNYLTLESESQAIVKMLNFKELPSCSDLWAPEKMHVLSLP